MQNKFEKILDLVRMTGDKMIVVDKDDPNDGYVVMDLREYKQLIEDNKWLEEESNEEWEDCKDYLNRSWDSENDIYSKDNTPIIDLDDKSDVEDEYDDYMDDNGEDNDDMFDITEFSDNDENSPINNEIPFPESDYNVNNEENQTELDNNREYGNIEHTTKEGKNSGKLSKWQISEDIKNTGEYPSPNSSFLEEDDRYYLETI